MRLTRKPGRRTLIVTAIVTALALSGVAAAFGRVDAALEPIGPSGLVDDRHPRIGVELGWAVRDPRILISGREAPNVVRRGDRLIARGLDLPDGAYDVRVTGRTPGPLGRELSREWSLEVDTVAPRLEAETERYVSGRATRVRGRTERGEQVTATVAGRVVAEARADRRGDFDLRVPLDDGDQRVKLSAADAAGNVRTISRVLTSDVTPPRLTLAGSPRVADTATPTVSGEVRDEGPVRIEASVAGASSQSAEEEVRRGSFDVPVGALHEGTHRIEVVARDSAGNEASTSRTVLVDSTDEFGAATLGPGARGGDVRELLGHLRRHGGYRGPIRSVLGPEQIEAVRDYQRAEGLAVDGLVGPEFRAVLLAEGAPEIVVDLSELTLTVERDGVAASSYPVAIGQPAYPTPTGSFEVIDMQVDPAWTPPDSPWAAELESIPPGPGNPLGTRWIGVSSPGIGIHGTYDSGSIGTQASHGCIRMQIDDVEAVYEEVELGTPVVIQG